MLKLSPIQPYNLISLVFGSNFESAGTVQVNNGLPNVELRQIEGFSLFDWAKVFEKATNIEPNFDFAYYNIALLNLKIVPKDVEKSIENLRKAISLNPEFSNWVKEDACEHDYLKPIREHNCFKCIVLKK